jgi:hypothetical protein
MFFVAFVLALVLEIKGYKVVTEVTYFLVCGIICCSYSLCFMVSVLVFIENNCKDIRVQSVTEAAIRCSLKLLPVTELANDEMLLLILAGHVAHMGATRNCAKILAGRLHCRTYV